MLFLRCRLSANLRYTATSIQCRVRKVSAPSVFFRKVITVSMVQKSILSITQFRFVFAPGAGLPSVGFHFRFTTAERGHQRQLCHHQLGILDTQGHQLFAVCMCVRACLRACMHMCICACGSVRVCVCMPVRSCKHIVGCWSGQRSQTISSSNVFVQQV